MDVIDDLKNGLTDKPLSQENDVYQGDDESDEESNDENSEQEEDCHFNDL